MATTNSYLNFNGDTEEAFNSCKSGLGRAFSMLQRSKEIFGEYYDKDKKNNACFIGRYNTFFYRHYLLCCRIELDPAVLQM